MGVGTGLRFIGKKFDEHVERFHEWTFLPSIRADTLFESLW